MTSAILYHKIRSQSEKSKLIRKKEVKRQKLQNTPNIQLQNLWKNPIIILSKINCSLVSQSNTKMIIIKTNKQPRQTRKLPNWPKILTQN